MDGVCHILDTRVNYLLFAPIKVMLLQYKEDDICRKYCLPTDALLMYLPTNLIQRQSYEGKLFRFFCHFGYGEIVESNCTILFQIWKRVSNVLNFPRSYYSISQEICTRFLLCCALLWLYIDWFTHIHQAYFTGTVAIWRLPQCQQSNPDGYG